VLGGDVTGIADARIEREIHTRLAEGPVAIEDLVAASVGAAQHAIGGHEGSFHALLHRLVRAGRVCVVGRAPSGGAIYGLAGAERVTDLDAAAPIPTPVSTDDSRIALFVASRVRDPDDRGRVVADVLAHRAALAAGGRIREFGSRKAARDLLRRVDRGRFAIVCPDSPWESFLRFVRHEGPSILLTLAVLAVLWRFVAEFRVVPSNSMQAGIKPGDRLLVWKWPWEWKIPWKDDDPPTPERWQVIVFQRPDGLVLIKRVAGLPGESLSIDDGDLLVNGVVATKPDDLREAMREPLVRATADGRGRFAGWSHAADGWQTFAGALRADEPTFLDERGNAEIPRTPRPPNAHDVYVTVDAGRDAAVRLRFLDESGRLSAADAGEIVVTRDAAGAVSLSRTPPAGKPERIVLTSGTDGGPGATASITLSVVDGVLRLESGTIRYATPLATRRPLGRVVAEVAVRGAVQAVAIDRDVHYTQPEKAQFAIDPATPFRVPDDRIFLLGDHSAYSNDSRFVEVGAVPTSRILGRAVFRIWPVSRVGLVR
jgi:signal peptidase I